jgi:hypothetical protein
VTKTLVAVVVGLALSSGVAHAQMCQGRASFRDTSAQVSMGGAFQTGARGFEVGVRGGGDQVFGGVGASIVNYDALGTSSKAVSGNIGQDYWIDRVHVCPNIEAAYIFGPNVGDVTVNGLSFLGGVNVGVPVTDWDIVNVVPTFGGGVLYQRAKASLGGVDQTTTQTGGVAMIGVGVVLNKRIAVVPLVEIPIGLAQTNRIFDLTLAINFGQR